MSNDKTQQIINFTPSPTSSPHNTNISQSSEKRRQSMPRGAKRLDINYVDTSKKTTKNASGKYVQNLEHYEPPQQTNNKRSKAIGLIVTTILY